MRALIRVLMGSAEYSLDGLGFGVGFRAASAVKLAWTDQERSEEPRLASWGQVFGVYVANVGSKQAPTSRCARVIMSFAVAFVLLRIVLGFSIDHRDGLTKQRAKD